jgi:Esterase PHB depolymerase/Ribbon-Helix-Helix transcriptional regulator family
VDRPIAGKVHELRPKTGDPEKITINLGYFDLGHINLMAQEGFYAVDPQRVYVARPSAGAAAAIMGMTYPDLYAAIGVHSGLAYGAAGDLPSAFAAMQQAGTTAVRGSGAASAALGCRRLIPTIVFHGDQDTTVHPRNGDHVIAESRAASMADLQKTVQHGRVPGGHGYSRILHTDVSGQATLSTGSSTAPGMPGRAAAPPAHIPIRKGPTPRGRCCASSSSTEMPKPCHLSRLTERTLPRNAVIRAPSKHHRCHRALWCAGTAAALDMRAFSIVGAPPVSLFSAAARW